MRIYDISVALGPELPTYDDAEPGPTLEPFAALERGDPANVSVLRLGVHSGTHVDAPCHFFPAGAGVDAVPLERLVGPALVVAFAAPEAIRAADLDAAGIPPGTRRLLCKTRNGALWERAGFQRDFVFLAPDAADWLLARGVELIGIDYLSIERYGSPDFAVHRRLLQAGVVILEGLDLRAVPPGPYLLAALPLKLAGADGAPTRAVLIAD
jgi:arylformamidase